MTISGLNVTMNRSTSFPSGRALLIADKALHSLFYDDIGLKSL